MDGGIPVVPPGSLDNRNRQQPAQRRSAPWGSRSPRLVSPPAPVQRGRLRERKAPRGRSTETDADRERLLRQFHHRPRGPRGGPQAPRYVHRFHRRARPAPHGVGGRRQLRRRGAGRSLRHGPGHPAGRRRRPGRGQRPWHPGRHAPGREAAHGRGHHDHPARGREVRRQELRASPAVCTASASPSSTRCPRASTSASGATAPSGTRATTYAKPGPLEKVGPTKKRGTAITFWADGDIFETTTYSFDTINRRLQEMAFLNKGLTIVLRDERPGHSKAETGLADGGHPRRGRPAAGHRGRGVRGHRDHLQVRRRPRGLRRAHQRQEVPDPQVHRQLLRRRRRQERHGDEPRRRDAVVRRLLGVGLHVRQHHQHARGRHPRGGLPRGADVDRQPVRGGQEDPQGEGREAHG